MTEPETSANPPIPRLRWFQFRLRTLFILTAIVAVGLGTLTLKWRVQQQRAATLESLKSHLSEGAYVWIRWSDVPWWSAEPRHVGFGARGDGLPAVPGVNDQQLGQLIPRLRTVESLSLQASPVTHVGLAHLEGLPKLESLSIGGCTLGDAELEVLAGLTGLRQLSLSYTGVTDSSLAHLRDLSTLEHLELIEFHNDRLTGVGLRQLIHLPNLQRLDLGCPNRVDFWLAQLEGFPSLRELRLHAAGMTGEGLSHLSTLPKLQRLVLISAGSLGKSDGIGLKHLAEAPNLKYLCLRWCEVNDRDLVELEELISLGTLEFRETEVTEESLAKLRKALPNTKVIVTTERL